MDRMDSLLLGVRVADVKDAISDCRSLVETAARETDGQKLGEYLRELRETLVSLINKTPVCSVCLHSILW